MTFFSKYTKQLRFVFTIPGFVALMAVGFQCGPIGGNSDVVTLFTTGTGVSSKVLAQGGGEVPIGEIENLIVELNRITFKGPAAAASGGEVEVFDAAAEPDVENDIDLKDLTTVSQIVSFRDIPAGTYNQVRLHIDNPRLRLVGDPEGEFRTNVQLTANDRLFITGQFTLAPDEKVLIQIDFGGLKLNEKGNGDFVLTPQLRAEILVGETDVVLQGVIVSRDEGAQTLEVQVDDGPLPVDASSAMIFLPGDTDVATGDFVQDLTVGTQVEVEGVIDVECRVTADVITVLPPLAGEGEGEIEGESG